MVIIAVVLIIYLTFISIIYGIIIKYTHIYIDVIMIAITVQLYNWDGTDPAATSNVNVMHH